MKSNRIVTNEDIIKYEAMVERYIRDSVFKNWSNELGGRITKDNGDVFLGNSGYSLNDIRQHLRTEVCIALKNFDPNYRTKDNKTVKESTYVFMCLGSRIGQLMKRLVKPKNGYGVRHNQIEEVLWEIEED